MQVGSHVNKTRESKILPISRPWLPKITTLFPGLRTTLLSILCRTVDSSRSYSEKELNEIRIRTYLLTKDERGDPAFSPSFFMPYGRGGGELIEDPYEEERKADAGRHGSTTTGRIIPRLNVLIPDHQGTGSVYIGP